MLCVGLERTASSPENGETLQLANPIDVLTSAILTGFKASIRHNSNPGSEPAPMNAGSILESKSVKDSWM